MQLVQPFISSKRTMMDVCRNARNVCRYDVLLLEKLPAWLEEPKNERMTRGAQLMGFSRTRAVWLFGFMPGSPEARAYGIDTGIEGFCFVLADHRGEIVDVFNGVAFEMPEAFRRTIDAKVF